jgi:FkbM family methyltransferase
MNNYKSQIGQDKVLDEQIFNGKRNGIFVEVGALDGYGASNTYFFEKERNWSGLLIEPNPIEFSKITNHPRNLSVTENCAISQTEGEVNFLSIGGPCNVLSGIMEFYNPQHLQRIEHELNMYKDYPVGHELYSTKEIIKIRSHRLETLFDKYGYKDIDFISIDVEGAELEVIKSINFDKVNIKCFMLENNYGLEEETAFLTEKGYTLAGNIQWDSVFVKK